MISLMFMTTGTEIHEDNFKEGSIPVCWIYASTVFQNFKDEISLRMGECEILL